MILLRFTDFRDDYAKKATEKSVTYTKKHTYIIPEKERLWIV